ncbi:MAG: hypothetical protein KF746_20040 [Chitinophagaceae bacterium]|nr:hypothetical protein [Chitinophagaceae bacterium]
MKKILFPLAGVLLFAASCKKNDSGSNNNFSNTKDAEKITRFFSDNARSKESFTIDAGSGGNITTSKGTKISFPADVFKTAAGDAVAGSVNIKVLDVLEPRDMILNGKPTITVEGEQLISFGEIVVNAEQGGNPLRLNNDRNEQVRVVFPIGGVQAGGQDVKEVPLWNGIEAEESNQDVSGHNHVSL